MDLGREIVALMDREAITQAQVAGLAGVSQASVSRLVREASVGRATSAQRSGAARAKLAGLIHQHSDSQRLPAALLEAIRSVWDGSDAHAQALAAMIKASGALWPSMGSEVADAG